MKPVVRGLRLIGSTVLISSIGGFGVLCPPPVSADALPNSPMNPAAIDRWINPDLRQGENSQGIRLEITEMPTNIPLGGNLRIGLRIINDSTTDLSGFSIVPQHADATDSVSNARSILHQSEDQFPYVGGYLESTEIIAPGQTRELSFDITTGAGLNDSLNIGTAGVYPMLIGLRDAVNHSILSTQRFLLTIGDTTNQTDTTESENNSVTSATGMTVIYPLSATVDILGGETGEAPNPAPLILQSDDLAAQLADGGRLESLLENYETAIANSTKLAQASCLAIDPELIDTVARMSNGYTVSTTRPSTVSQKRRLRDSWTLRTEQTYGQPGTGATNAKRWLQRLSTTAQQSGCVVALPWANADLNTVAQMKNTWLMREAIQHGNQTIENLLQVAPIKNVVIPGSGYVTEETADQLGWVADKNTDLSLAWDEVQTGLSSTEPEIGDSTVSVLVADNTVWNVPRAGRFGQLRSHIRSVAYQGSLAATLAEATDIPTTVGYGSYTARYDYRLDSVAARRATADAAIWLSLNNQSGEGTEPVMVQLPPLMSQSKQWLSTMTELLESGAARPMTLNEYLSIDASQLAELNAQVGLQESPESTPFGAPYDDPTMVSDLEIVQAQRQLESVDTLTELVINDPAIALTPYGFTAPLRRDMLRAFTRNERGTIDTYDAHVEAVKAQLNNNYEVLSELRKSVTLLPPGNVYTRISSSSPLPIVAQNGLPLPVDAQIHYAGPADARLVVPETIIIPAKGSITINMTADLPKENTDTRTDLSLWLTTSNDAPFSEPVTIGVRTRSGITSGYGVATILLIVLTLALATRIYIRKRRS